MSNIKHPVYAIRVLRHKIAEHKQVVETINATIHGMELRGNNDVDHLKAERLKHKNAISDLKAAIKILQNNTSK